MKLKNLKKGGKDKTQQKVQKTKKQPENTLKNLEDEQRDDELVDIKQDLTKKNQTKAKTVKRVEGNKLQQVEYDTTKLLQVKQQIKKPMQSWVPKNLDDVLKKDFKMEQHQTEFESLTDNSINQKLKEKKQKQKEIPKVVEEVGGIKFAPLISETKVKEDKSQPLILGKQKTVNSTNSSIITNLQPVKNFTNSNLQGKFVQIQKSPQQLRQEQIQRKIQEKKINEPQVIPSKGKGGWFGTKKTTNNQPQKVEQFKPTVMNFTNSKKQIINQGNFKFAELQKSAQQLRMQALQKSDNQVFVSKKQQQERRKKRQQKEKLQVKVDVNVMN